MMSQEINERILEALNAGYDPQEILGALSMSKDPGHQSWYENYSQTMRDRARETDSIDQRPKPANTSNIATVKQHIEETPFLQLGAEAAALAAVPVVGKRIIDRLLPTASEKQYAEQNRIAAEKLKASQSGELSPLEQARIDTEKAKADAIRKKIEMMDKKMAQEEMKRSSLATPTSMPEGPPPPLKDAPLVESGLQNTFQNELNKQVEGLQKAGAVPGSAAPNVAPQPVAPAVPAAPAATPTVTQAVEAGVSPTQALQVEVAKQIDATPAQTTQPAEPPKNKGGRPTKAAKEAQLAGGVFKEGFGGADNWMQSQVGHDIRRFIRDEFNAGKPYGGGQAAMDKAYADVGRYEQWLKENIPVQTLNRAERKAVGIPSPEPYGPLGKAMKVGGVAGLLMTAAQAANAKQAAQNVGEALLPIGMTPSELATGTLTEKQLRAFQEAQKLGSPYRSVPPPR